MPKCDCRLCSRYKKYKIMIEKIDDREAKEFFQQIFDALNDVEEELDFEKIYTHNLKVLYPKIYREAHTVKPLKSGDEKYPEYNI